MAIHNHKTKRSVHCMVVTISDTRTEATDKSGHFIKELLEEEGHVVTSKKIVKDEEQAIRDIILKGCNHPHIDAVLTNGGTGIAFRDVTIEVVKEMLDKEIPGFGEIFRLLSYQEDIGSAAIMSRAIAGVSNHTVIFAMPGSLGAVKLAMNKLILPELAHVVNEIKKDLPKK